MWNEKYIPVLLSGAVEADIPTPLQGYTYYRADTEAGYQALYRHLTDQPAVVKPKLGRLRTLPPLPPAPPKRTAEPPPEPAEGSGEAAPAAGPGEASPEPDAVSPETAPREGAAPPASASAEASGERPARYPLRFWIHLLVLALDVVLLLLLPALYLQPWRSAWWQVLLAVLGQAAVLLGLLVAGKRLRAWVARRMEDWLLGARAGRALVPALVILLASHALLPAALGRCPDCVVVRLVPLPPLFGDLSSQASEDSNCCLLTLAVSGKPPVGPIQLLRRTAYAGAEAAEIEHRLAPESGSTRDGLFTPLLADARIPEESRESYLAAWSRPQIVPGLKLHGGETLRIRVESMDRRFAATKEVDLGRGWPFELIGLDLNLAEVASP
jgi:hypothetical protein